VSDHDPSDGTPDHTSPHRPGFRFIDHGELRDAADAAYEERRARLSDAHRARDAVPPLATPFERRLARLEAVRREEPAPRRAERETPTPDPTRSLEELRADADAAYAARSRRLGARGSYR
jgi:hypothetical protein